MTNRINALVVSAGLLVATSAHAASVSVNGSNSGATVAPGATISVAVTGAATLGDWIGICNAGVTPADSQCDLLGYDWVFPNCTQEQPSNVIPSATCNLTAPNSVGNYIAGLFANYSYSPRATAGFSTVAATSGPLHYAPNGNFDANGNFLPGRYGFNLADVSSAGLLSSLPSGVQALVYVGLCNGNTSAFQQAVAPFLHQAKVWGYFLFDDPADHNCAAANLKAETDYLHAQDGKPVFIDLDNQSSWTHPSFAGYNSQTTDADYFGIGPYPCRSEYPGFGGVSDCNYGELTNGIFAAMDAGIGPSQIVVLWQTFCGGNWTNDAGGTYTCPTYQQYVNIVQTTTSLLNTLSGGRPAPFDVDYSFGVQNNDIAIVNNSTLQQAVSDHNSGNF